MKYLLPVLLLVVSLEAKDVRPQGDIKKEMAKCAAIENSIERLAAYDTLAEKMGVVKSTPKINTLNKWVMSTDVSPIDDSKSYILMLDSNESVPARFGKVISPSLIIRHNRSVLAEANVP